MQDELWSKFLQTGSVSDYLKYRFYNKQNEDKQINANEDAGTCNKRTDGWRE